MTECGLASGALFEHRSGAHRASEVGFENVAAVEQALFAAGSRAAKLQPNPRAGG